MKEVPGGLKSSIRMIFSLPGRKPLITASCVLLCFSFASLAQQNSTQSSNSQKSGQANQQQAQPPKNPALPQQTAAGAPVDSSKYKIGPTDVINVQVWHEPEFSGPVAVHEDGKFTLPLVGDLQAGGLTPVEVEKNVAKALAKYVVNPLVTVTVQEVLSKKYYMDGEINRPGEYALVAPTTILEAISKAGGLQEFANGKKIYVLRGTKRIPFNYKDVSRGKHMEQNIELQPGDHVFVP